MPTNDVISSFINIPQVQSEIDVTTAGLQGIKDLILSMPQVLGNYKGSTDLQQSRQATDELVRAQQALIDSQKTLNVEIEKSRILSRERNADEQASLEALIATRIKLQNAVKSYNIDEKENLELLQRGKITRDEYNQRMIETTATVERHKTRIVDLNARIKENTTESVVAKTAYKALTDQYNAAALAAKNYSITLGANHPETIKAAENAKKLSTQLKEVDASVGQNQRNVGGYAEAISQSFSRVTSAANISRRVITMLSRQIIGLGVGMLSFVIGAKAIEMVGNLIAAAWDRAHEAINQYRLKLTILNEVIADGNKKAGEQIADLKILYAEATNVNQSMDDRLKAVQALKTEFPDYFGKLNTELILTGKATDAYEQLTQAIIKSSRAKAAKDKIDDIERQRLDIAFQKEKINNATANEKNRAKDQNFYTSTGGSFGMGSSQQGNMQTAGEERAIIEQRRLKALAKQDKADGYLKAQEDFLTQFVGADQLAKVVEEQNKPGKEKKPKKIHEDSENLADEYRKKDLETLKKASIDELNILKDKYRQEADDQNASLDKRYAAQALYNAANLTLIQKDKQSTLDELKLEIEVADKKAMKLKDATKRNDALIAINKYMVDKVAEINRKAELDNERAEEDDYKRRIVLAKKHIADLQQLKEETFKNASNITDISKDQQLLQLDKDFQDGKIKDIEDYDRKRKQIEDNAAIDHLEHQIAADKADLNLMIMTNVDRLALEKKMADEEVILEDLKNEKIKQSNKRLEDAKKQMKSEAADLVIALVDGSYTKELNSLQDQIDANTKLKDAQIERINTSTLSEQDKAAKLAQINAEAQAKQDSLEKKKRDTQLKQARFDRDAQVLKITGEAIAAHFKTLAQLGPIAGPPVALAEDLVAALQIGLLLAKPLPKFASGTDFAPGGLALTDEKGPEGYITPSGKTFIGNDQPTIRHLERGTKIIPHDRLNEMLLNSMMRSTAARIQKDNSSAEIRDAIVWASQETIKAMGKQKTKIVNNIKVDVGWAQYIDKNVKN